MTWEFREEAEVLEALSRHFQFPNDYLVTDLETTGFSKTNDFIVDCGWAVVKDGRLVHHNSMLLDWSRVPVDHQHIQRQLRRQAEEYAAQGRPHYYSWERLKAEGEHPLEVLHAYTTLLYEYIINKGFIVGHGLWRFDKEVINSHTQRFLQGYLLPWRMHSIFDTGLLEKAAQTSRPPMLGETLDEWLKRVNNAFSKVKWNMDPHCVNKYHLRERYGADMQLMHTAGFDCVLIHLLLDTFRQLTEILNGQKSSLENIPIFQTGG